MDVSSEYEANRVPTAAILFTIQVQGEVFTLHPYLIIQPYPNSERLTYKIKYKVHDSHDHLLSLNRIPEILRDFTDFSQLGALINDNSGELLEVLGVEVKLEEQETNIQGNIPDQQDSNL